jgi:hypothetical protein
MNTLKRALGTTLVYVLVVASLPLLFALACGTAHPAAAQYWLSKAIVWGLVTAVIVMLWQVAEATNGGKN